MYVGVIHNIIIQNDFHKAYYKFNYSREDGTAKYYTVRIPYEMWAVMCYVPISGGFEINLSPALNSIKYDP